ncbi:MAG: hypothetical protein ABIY39_12080 [Sphingomonas sp.]
MTGDDRFRSTVGRSRAFRHASKADTALDQMPQASHVHARKGTTMVSTSNEGIMSEYLVKYALVKSSERERPTDLLETLYISERFQAGDDLKPLRENYDHSVWNGVPASEIDRRLAALDDFMKELARNRAAMWGLN